MKNTNGTSETAIGLAPPVPPGDVLPGAITPLENEIASLIAVAVIRLRSEVDEGATRPRGYEKATPSAELDSPARP